MATHEIVGWAMEDHMRAELCCAALEMALGRRGPVPELIHHSPPPLGIMLRITLPGSG
ncbi:hypothetical protein OAN307_c31880 [Octadecabacter antarcticus 307]|uniref:Uncharacterized protein n=1 Tax=Octadecabacter antarcticus 307 TaxID=391626 RepID=M9RE67_9RHOB|nr:hypothetical protein OAN307_c31880 [Octadecabacter antarcticus 307]